MESIDAANGDGINPATETLLCNGPFEVLRLIPGLFQPDEIKRQYRRLALILHPDKNRHKDAEAAFKKLTAAFEKLHDPVQQAASRADAERDARRRRKRNASASADGDRESHSSAKGSSGSTARSGGDAPKWCREGEYVPEQKKEEPPETEERKAKSKNLWEEFEQQEKVFKEEVAQAKEFNAEKKRAKAEARERKDRERIDRLRETVLEDYQNDTEVEAKTASWQRFNAKTFSNPTRKRQQADSGSDIAAAEGKGQNGIVGYRKDRKSVHSVGDSDLAGDIGGSTTAQHRNGANLNAASSLEGIGVGEEKRGEGGGVTASFACWVCRRGFKSAKALAHHEAKSELHLINVQLRDLLSP